MAAASASSRPSSARSSGRTPRTCFFSSFFACRSASEADRHAKKELKKHVRGVRPLERALEGRDDAEAAAIRGYCLAVRGALTDDGQPPLSAAGLKLHD